MSSIVRKVTVGFSNGIHDSQSFMVGSSHNILGNSHEVYAIEEESMESVKVYLQNLESKETFLWKRITSKDMILEYAVPE